MPRIFVNGAERSGENMTGTWGDLLPAIEQDAAARGEVVSAVRFDGVDEPAFHQGAPLERSLADVRLVDVETGTPAGLLAAALDEGAAAAITLAAVARDTSQAFRTGDAASANGQFAELCQGVRSLLAVLSIGAQAIGGGLDGTDWNGQPVSARLDRIAALLERLVEAQHAGDWVILAEVVEHDLHPLLASAAPLLDTLRRATHARV